MTFDTLSTSGTSVRSSQWKPTSAKSFRAAPAVTFGNAPRVDPRIRTPLRTNWDIAWQKTQTLHATRITIRAEVINAFDDPALSAGVGGRDQHGVVRLAGGGAGHLVDGHVVGAEPGCQPLGQLVSQLLDR